MTRACVDCGVPSPRRPRCDRCRMCEYNARNPLRHRRFNKKCGCGASISKDAKACATCATRDPKPTCRDCGGPASKASDRCLLCKSGRTPTCAHCGNVFYKPDRQQTTCSPECAAARHQAFAEATRIHGGVSEKNRTATRRRRERLRAVGGRQEPGRWLRICARDDWQCWICGGAIDPTLIAPHRYSGTADHVVALVDGGGDGDDNLRPAHFRCNSKRQHGGSHRYAEAVQ